LVKLNGTSVVPDRKGKGRAIEGAEETERGGAHAEDMVLLPTLLDLSMVKGSMLCEEMGERSHNKLRVAALTS
jgi:E3 ubiquitin-protein ligase SHPRH